MRKHAHARPRGVWWNASPEKLGALRSFRRFINQELSSPTRMHGGSNTIVRHDTHQSSEAFQSLQSTLYVSDLMSWASFRRIDDLDKNSFMVSTLYFILTLVQGGDLHLQYACAIAGVIVIEHTTQGELY